MHYDVLIVDDEAELGTATKEYFEAFGISADFVNNAGAAIQWLKTNTADLLLLDINLKESSGFELCKSIRREYDMPILVQGLLMTIFCLPLILAAMTI